MPVSSTGHWMKCSDSPRRSCSPWNPRLNPITRRPSSKPRSDSRPRRARSIPSCRPAIRRFNSRHDTQLETIRADYEKQLSAIKVEAHHGHNRVNQKAAELVSAAEKEYRDQVMTADFVAEGAATRVQQGRVVAQAEVQNARRYLEALAAQAAGPAAVLSAARPHAGRPERPEAGGRIQGLRLNLQPIASDARGLPPSPRLPPRSAAPSKPWPSSI